MTQPRRIDVSIGRLERWIAGFSERHGDSTWSLDGSAYLLTGADGAWARLSGWTEASVLPPDVGVWARPPDRIGVILIRRGGYAVGVAQGQSLVAHKCGTRYVQSRTTAGGWSQQRYARRRGNQADALARVVAERTCDMFAEWPPDALVIGGDRALVAQVLKETTVRVLSTWSKREFYDIPDPRFAVLKDLVERARAVQVIVCNAPFS